MCELLNRIWSRPRGEWTRVLRRELPALAAEIVEELLHGIPGFSDLIDDNDAIDDELVRQKVEKALLSALGYPDPDERAPVAAAVAAVAPAPAPAPDGARSAADHEDRHDGRRDARREDMREAVRDSVREPVHDSVRGARPLPEDGPGGPGGGASGGRGCHGGHAGGHAGPGVQSGGQGERPGPVEPPDRARQDLFKALTDDRAASEGSLTQLAEEAGWPLPAAVRAVVPALPGETHQLAAVLDAALPGTFAGRPCLLVPSPDPDTRSPLELPLRGRAVAVGHAVSLRDTASSLRWALRLIALTPVRPAPDARAVFVDDHLSTLLLLQDEPLAHALAARWLQPLADLTPRQSERLEVTLLAWLEGGGAPEAAKALNVHPQTVRYRMRQLEKLFGPGLRDPRTRFELEMALRSRRLMAHVRRQNARVGRRTQRVVTADFTPVVVGRMARVNGL
ncbi:Purine catabolism regulatory protein [Streptomyces xanthophaeus]|uniref:PucR family transcriptional regulator n=1 Tax=Streptomyces xanthophaeus TaxID=67385 RepID=UPI00233E87F5|nr:PucR family transcriptional regulator [Streptomyces xanthophaeus]WCD89831.1 Purine catabolism regulatory protein [Streptomyces xanthophaeus]